MNKDKERNLYKESKRNQYRGIFDTPPRPRARPREGTQARYKESGAAADELIEILGGNRKKDHGIWSYYCYHHDIEKILDEARAYRKKYEHGKIRNPITAFQRWLIRNYGREAK